MVLVRRLIVIFTATLAHLRLLVAARGPARPAAPTRAARPRLAIVRPRVAVRNRQCAGRAWGRPVKALFRIVPEHPARERNPVLLATTRSLGLASTSLQKSAYEIPAVSSCPRKRTSKAYVQDAALDSACAGVTG